MIQCANCGADNRDTAKYCKVCGNGLLLPVVPKPPTLLGPLSPWGTPAPGRQGGGLAPATPSLPATPFAAPVGFPKVWKTPLPLTEGRVVHVDAPVQEQTPPGPRILVAVILALIRPVLAMLAQSLMPPTSTVRYLRVEDWQTGRQRSIKVRGDPSGIISVGDWVAVWGTEDSGNIIMHAAYNYSTDAEVRVK